MPDQTVTNLSIGIKASMGNFNKSLKIATQNLVAFQNAAKDVSKALDKAAPVKFQHILQQNLIAISKNTKMIAQFARGAKGATPSLETLGKGLNGVLNGFDKVGVAANKAGNMIKKGAEKGALGMFSLSTMAAKIAHYISFSIGVQMVQVVRNGIRQIIDIFSEFERAVTNAATISGYLGSAFEGARKHIADLSRELGRETVYSATEVAQAFYSLASAGYDVAKITKSEMIPILDYAAATQSDLDEATKAVLVTLKQFKMETSETGHVVDVFTTAITSSFQTMEKLKEGMKYAGPIAGILGVGLEETTAALTSLVDRGLEGGQAGQRLNMVFTKLLKPTDQAKEMFESMGLTMKDLDPAAHSLTEILYTLQGAGFGAAEAATMFRARTAGAASVLVENADAIARMTTRLEMADGITRQVAEAQEDTLWGSLKKTTNEMNVMATEVGEKLAPFVTWLAKVVRDSLSPALNALASVFTVISKNANLFKAIFASLTVITVAYYAKVKLIPKVISMLSVAVKGAGVAYDFLTGAIVRQWIANLKSTASMVATTYATVGLTAAIANLTIAMLSNPVTWFGVAIAGVAMVLVHFASKEEELTETQKELNNRMSEFQKIINDYGDASELAAAELQNIYVEMARGYKQTGLYADEFERLAEITGKTVSELTSVDAVEFASEETLEGIRALTQETQDGIVSLTKWIDANLTLSQSFANYEIVLANYLKTAKELDVMNRLQEAFGKRIVQLRQKQIQVEQRYAEAEKMLVKYTGQLLQSIRQIPGNLENYVSELEKAYEASASLVDKNDQLGDVNRDLKYATDDLADALIRYGAGTREAIEAEEDLEDLIRTRISIQDEINDLELESVKTKELLEKVNQGVYLTTQDAEEATLELSEAEKTILGYANEMMQFREDMINAKAEEAIWSAKLAAMDKIRSESSTYMDEALVKLYETEDKIFDIEYKLYKLRRGEDEQLDELFGSLAKQGLINDEIIKQYSDMKKSEGDVLKLNHEFAQLMDDLTPTQQDFAEQLLNSEKGTQAYNDALAGLSGVEGLDTILAMSDATSSFTDTIDILSGSMGPMIGSLVDMGLVNDTTAKQYYDLIDNAYELASGEKKLSKEQNKLGDNFDSVLDVVSQLAMSLVDGEDGVNTVADAFGELTNTLGIGAMDVDELNSLLGTGKGYLSEFADEELILAAALKTVGSDLGMYQQGMSGAQLAVDLGLVSQQNLNQAIGLLSTQVSNSLTPLTTYKDALNNVTTSAGLADDALDNLLTTTSELGDYLENPITMEVTTTEIENAPDDVQALIDKVDELITVIEEDLPDAGNEGGLSFVQQLQAGLAGVSAMFQNTVINPITNAWNSLKSTVGNAWSGLMGFLGFAEQGAIVKAATGYLTKGPQMAMIGESGTEAVIPLEGRNRKYGEDLLAGIIPKYFPDIARQLYGLQQTQAAAKQATTVREGNTSTYYDNFNMYGPVNVQTNNPSDFMEQMKWNMRASRR